MDTSEQRIHQRCPANQWQPRDGYQRVAGATHLPDQWRRRRHHVQLTILTKSRLYIAINSAVITKPCAPCYHDGACSRTAGNRAAAMYPRAEWRERLNQSLTYPA